MKKRQREEVRERADARKRCARERAREAAARQQVQAAAAQQSLLRGGINGAERSIQYLPEVAKGFVQRLLQGPSSGRRLVVSSQKAALARLAEVSPLRPIETWRPRGKGRDSVFRSLCEHLLTKYPTPPFLWSAFEDEVNGAELVPLVVHVAQGGSLFQFCKDGKLPFSLTRSQCAEFMQTSTSLGVLPALRRVQVKAEGGDRRLFEVWRRLPSVMRLQTPELESFGVTVLRFFARNPMLDPAQIGPLYDYVHHRYRLNPAFSMQGRTAQALLRDMAAWHQELNNVRLRRNETHVAFERSGFKQFRVQRKEKVPLGKGGKVGEALHSWAVQEILSSKELMAEGRALRHCVYSYRWQVEAKRTSIWSLSGGLEGAMEKLITLEVSNATRAIVQARGAHNRLTNTREDRVILEWASMNGLAVHYGKRW